MEMYAYIYLKDQKKYLITTDSKIEDFYYQTPGRQSKEFSAKPFKYFPDKESNNKNFATCQILIVAGTYDKFLCFVQSNYFFLYEYIYCLCIHSNFGRGTKFSG